MSPWQIDAVVAPSGRREISASMRDPDGNQTGYVQLAVGSDGTSLAMSASRDDGGITFLVETKLPLWVIRKLLRKAVEAIGG